MITNHKRHCDYYVYIYLRKSDLTPYYVGKGRRDRAYQTHTVKIPTDRSRIVFVAKGLTEIGSFALERRLILWYGRKDNNTGILRNLTDGGEGRSGYRHKQSSKDLIGNAHKGKIVQPSTRELLKSINIANPQRGGTKNKGKPSPFKGRKYTPEESQAHSIRQTKRFSRTEERSKLLELAEKARQVILNKCPKLLVKDLTGQEKIYQSIRTFALVISVKSRNISHLVAKYNGRPIPLGRFKGFIFQSLSPQEVGDREIHTVSSMRP